MLRAATGAWRAPIGTTCPCRKESVGFSCAWPLLGAGGTRVRTQCPRLLSRERVTWTVMAASCWPLMFRESWEGHVPADCLWSFGCGAYGWSCARSIFLLLPKRIIIYIRMHIRLVVLLDATPKLRCLLIAPIMAGPRNTLIASFLFQKISSGTPFVPRCV